MTPPTHPPQQGPDQQEQPPAPASELGAGCLLRVYWMMAGNALAAFAAYQIAQTGGLLSFVDVFFWASVLSLIAVRYVDIRALNGRTSEGQPASMSDWRAYALRVAAISAAVWIVAHGLGIALQ